MRKPAPSAFVDKSKNSIRNTGGQYAPKAFNGADMENALKKGGVVSPSGLLPKRQGRRV